MRLRRLAPGEAAWSDASFDASGVDEIVAAVRSGGDAAVARFAARFGDPPPRRISKDEMAAAARAVDPSTRGLLRTTHARIARFARAQRAALGDVSVPAGGMRAGHRAVPVRSAGIYVPGGRYPLASTVLMCATPARVAGVERVVLCTPDASPPTLAAASEAGVDECFEIGGAQAIAAMAYGTETVPRVDLVVGPGNAYVAAAKRAVFGSCGIDTIAGPSELVVIASRDARADLIAADLLAQAEHDPMARVMLLADDAMLADAVDAQIDTQLEHLPTAPVAAEALRRQGCCAVLPLERAAERANALAPEHLALHGAAAEALEPRLHAYGSLFAGSMAGEAFGDYGTGPNHVLPTGGAARFSSGLSVLTFLTIRTYLRSSRPPDARLIEDVAAFAGAEGLVAHRRAALLRHAGAAVRE